MNYSDMTVAELRSIAKSRGDIPGYSKMKKDDLIEKITQSEADHKKEVASGFSENAPPSNGEEIKEDFLNRSSAEPGEGLSENEYEYESSIDMMNELPQHLSSEEQGEISSLITKAAGIEVFDELPQVTASEEMADLVGPLGEHHIVPAPQEQAYPRNRHERRKARAMQKKMLGKFKARLHARGIKV